MQTTLSIVVFVVGLLVGATGGLVIGINIAENFFLSDAEKQQKNETNETNKTPF